MTLLSEMIQPRDKTKLAVRLEHMEDPKLDDQTHIYTQLLAKFAPHGYAVELLGRYGKDRYYFKIDDVIILISLRYLTSDAIGNVRNVRLPVYICSLLAYDELEGAVSRFLLGQLHELSVARLVNTFMAQGFQHSVRAADVCWLLQLDDTKVA